MSPESRASGGIECGRETRESGAWEMRLRGLGRKVVKREGTFSKASRASPVFASCLGFNLDAEKPTRFHMDGAEFGHSVVQYGGSW